jgi:hypothetical protein
LKISSWAPKVTRKRLVGIGLATGAVSGIYLALPYNALEKIGGSSNADLCFSAVPEVNTNKTYPTCFDISHVSSAREAVTALQEDLIYRGKVSSTESQTFETKLDGTFWSIKRQYSIPGDTFNKLTEQQKKQLILRAYMQMSRYREAKQYSQLPKLNSSGFGLYDYPSDLLGTNLGLGFISSGSMTVWGDVSCKPQDNQTPIPKHWDNFRNTRNFTTNAPFVGTSGIHFFEFPIPQMPEDELTNPNFYSGNLESSPNWLSLGKRIGLKVTAMIGLTNQQARNACEELKQEIESAR